jgi:hypothetical protein
MMAPGHVLGTEAELLELARARGVSLATLCDELMSRERPVAAPLPRLAAQLDTDGRLHEIAPQSEAMRLFEPAPRQLEGQTAMEVDAEQQARVGAWRRHEITSEGTQR